MRRRLVAIHRDNICPQRVNSDLDKGCIQQSQTVLRNGSAACNLLLLNLEDHGLIIGLRKRIPC
uniref:Uncharacterized protein n=1 Tax=Oryza brachyantha TaxID=4533 RepID=J3N8F8_ORYBR